MGTGKGKRGIAAIGHAVIAPSSPAQTRSWNSDPCGARGRSNLVNSPGEVWVKPAGRDLERFSLAATWVGLTQLVAGKVALQEQVEARDGVVLGDDQGDLRPPSEAPPVSGRRPPAPCR
jgi:hypothetical protein